MHNFRKGFFNVKKNSARCERSGGGFTPLRTGRLGVCLMTAWTHLAMVLDARLMGSSFRAMPGGVTASSPVDRRKIAQRDGTGAGSHKLTTSTHPSHHQWQNKNPGPAEGKNT
ncbi:hypothetical protein J6590_036380 [Homalodisca vitripennis]|nr:hypothetical protein J6590_036380 [Homalodisca vitripennis]